MKTIITKNKREKIEERERERTKRKRKKRTAHGEMSWWPTATISRRKTWGKKIRDRDGNKREIMKKKKTKERKKKKET